MVGVIMSSRLPCKWNSFFCGYRAGSDFKLIAGGSQTTDPIHLRPTSTDLEIVGAQSDSAGVTIDSRGSGTVKLKDGGNIRKLQILE